MIPVSAKNTGSGSKWKVRGVDCLCIGDKAGDQVENPKELHILQCSSLNLGI